MNTRYLESAADDICERVLQGRNVRGCLNLYDCCGELFSQHENILWMTRLALNVDAAWDLQAEIERRLRKWLEGRPCVLERAEELQAEEEETL